MNNLLASKLVDPVTSIPGDPRVVYPTCRSFDIVACPFADLFDLLAHHLRGRRYAFNCLENVFSLGPTIAVDECFKNPVLYRSLDLCSGEVLAPIDELFRDRIDQDSIRVSSDEL